MTPYREILRLHSHGINKTGIAASCDCARKTVARVLDRARELNLVWPLPENVTDASLQNQFFPKPDSPSDRRMPDLEYIHKELARTGVTLKLLWSEYCEQCRMHQELPLMYSQFCHHYQTYSEKKRAAMRMVYPAHERQKTDSAALV